MTTITERKDQNTHFILSMEELMHYEVHGKPQPIRLRRTSREYSRSYFEYWQKPLPFHSFFHKGTEMNAESNMLKRKCPLESGEEHTIASSSSHECLTRPCTCPDPGKSKEMCVIKKVENWLLGRCLVSCMANLLECLEPMNFNVSVYFLTSKLLLLFFYH